MYHESVHEHALGKVGALREIALAKEEGYNWWYAGFYIHSCPKMRYKGEYTPQYMLDPESYGWDVLSDEVKRKLDANKYLSLSREHALVAAAAAATATAPPPPTSPPPQADDAATADVQAESEPHTNPIKASVIKDSDEDATGSEDSGDDDDDPPVPNPELPLYKRHIPGILTKAQLLQDVDLDHIKLRIRTVEAETCMLVGWEEMSLDDADSIKARIAELAAAVGSELAREMVVSFG
jgi:arginine-tRNA-protein transferase